MMKLLSLLILALISFFTLHASDENVSRLVAENTVLKDTTIKKDVFASGEILQLSLTGNIRELLSDRGEQVRPHTLTLGYTETDGRELTLPVTVRTRGHFRKMRENCIYPPLMLQFSKTEKAIASTVFAKHKKLKLVMPCMSDDYVVREWMVYRLYNMITPKSLKARLVSVQLNDEKKKSNKKPFYGILLEEEQQMARRNNAVVVETKLLKPEDTKRKDFLTMAVFQYLIGNTDWSVQFLQNIKLIAADTNAEPSVVAYDFDHSGMVNAPYAQPAEALRMVSVKERRYRGYCIANMKEFAEVVTLFNSLKEDIYALYSTSELLDEKYKKATLKYFDEFYKTINDPEEMQKQFTYPCDKNGTGNIVIKGLQKD
jgi:hypothetical protein